MLHSPALEITWAQVAAMCCGAARGMLHLHAHSILHRDLKSGDLLLMALVIWKRMPQRPLHVPDCPHS